METFMWILGGIVLIALLVFLGYYYFAIYLKDRALTIVELRDRLRRNRAAYWRMTEQERNSLLGRNLHKSIIWIQNRMAVLSKIGNV